MNDVKRSACVKICCIASLDEARMAVRYGASAIGLVSAMPSGPGVIGEEIIAEIAAQISPPAETFLLTCLQDAAAIIAQHGRCRTTAIQLCDRLATESYSLLRDALPGIGLVQVIHVCGDESVQEASEAAPNVDALLLDSGNPALAVKQLGGTGRVHDWNLSRRIRESVDVPVFLAGGLTPENAAQALDHVRPYGLDVCSGVRTAGALDERKLARFMWNVRSQDSEEMRIGE